MIDVTPRQSIADRLGIDTRSEADQLTLRPHIEAHPLNFEDDQWLCQLGGIWVPKDTEANWRYREALIERAKGDVELQRTLHYLCEHDCLFWINTFAWTYSKKLVDEDGKESRNPRPDHPFVTWPIQDAMVHELIRSIKDGESILIDKSRDMGASWIILAVMTWFWLYGEGYEFLLMSRKEELVDDGKAQNKNTLFGKVVYMLDALPEWMQPARNKSQLKLVNLANGNLLDGESTNAAAGKGQRYDAAMVDEFAEIEKGETVADNLSDTTPCRIFNSTPKGPETGHSKIRRSGRVGVFVLHWVNHPNKGRNRHEVRDPASGQMKWTSPWYAKTCRGRSPQDIAINLDINHLGAGCNFFDLQVTASMRQKHAVDPLMLGRIHYKDGLSHEQVAQQLKDRAYETIYFEEAGDDPNAELSLWCGLQDDRASGRVRPYQGHAYCIGVDVSQGGGASNTVFSVGHREGPNKLVKDMEWASPDVLPHEAAQICVAMSLWIRGLNEYPLIVFERNGPGETFGAELQRFNYPMVFHERTIDRRENSDTGRFGWYSNAKSKLVLLEGLRKAYSQGAFINPSHKSYEEAEEYVWTNSGSVQPARTASDGKARATHGDVVIADGLLLMGLRRIQGYGAPEQLPSESVMAGRVMRRGREREAAQRAATTPAQRRYMQGRGGGAWQLA